MEKIRVLLVEDEILYRNSLDKALKGSFEIITAGTRKEMFDLLKKEGIDLILLDRHLPDGDTTDDIHTITRRPNSPPIIVVSGDEEIGPCLKSGALDYVIKARNEVTDLLTRIPMALERGRKNQAYEATLTRLRESALFKYEIIGSHPSIAAVREQIEAIAKAPAKTLILGETGTGKELIARRLHAMIAPNKPWVAVNCASIPQGIIESTLFGHVRGAFTGADQNHIGLFGQAQGGVLFLDEIDSIDSKTQAALLRVLESGEYTQVGGHRPAQFEGLIICASQSDISDEEVRRKVRFRDDLYYRVSTHTISLPPLRARKSDVPEMAKYFLFRANDPKVSFEASALKFLSNYDFPGNIRELKNIVEYCVMACHIHERTKITSEMISSRLLNRKAHEIRIHLPQSIKDIHEGLLEDTEQKVRKQLLSHLLALVPNRKALYEALGVSKATFFRMLDGLNKK